MADHGYLHPLDFGTVRDDRPQIKAWTNTGPTKAVGVFGSTQRWRPGFADATLIGGSQLVVGADAPLLDKIKAKWAAADKPTLAVTLGVGILLGYLGAKHMKKGR